MMLLKALPHFCIDFRETLELEPESYNLQQEVLWNDLNLSVVTRCSEETSISTSGTSAQTDQKLLNDTSGSPSPNWEQYVTNLLEEL